MSKQAKITPLTISVFYNNIGHDGFAFHFINQETAPQLHQAMQDAYAHFAQLSSVDKERFLNCHVYPAIVKARAMFKETSGKPNPTHEQQVQMLNSLYAVHILEQAGLLESDEYNGISVAYGVNGTNMDGLFSKAAA